MSADAPAAASSAPKAAPRPKRRWPRMLGEAAFVIVLLVAFRAWQGRALAARPPDGTLVTLDGTRFTPSAPGEPLVVHFFATWCGVCEAEEGNVAALARDHDMVAVCSQSGSAERVRAYLDEHGLAHVPVVLDATGDVAADWGVSAFPSTFYVDGAGDIDFAEVGYTSELGMRLRAFFTR